MTHVRALTYVLLLVIARGAAVGASASLEEMAGNLTEVETRSPCAPLRTDGIAAIIDGQKKK